MNKIYGTAIHSARQGQLVTIRMGLNGIDRIMAGDDIVEGQAVMYDFYRNVVIPATNSVVAGGNGDGCGINFHEGESKMQKVKEKTQMEMMKERYGANIQQDIDVTTAEIKSEEASLKAIRESVSRLKQKRAAQQKALRVIKGAR